MVMIMMLIIFVAADDYSKKFMRQPHFDLRQNNRKMYELNALSIVL